MKYIENIFVSLSAAFAIVSIAFAISVIGWVESYVVLVVILIVKRSTRKA